MYGRARRIELLKKVVITVVSIVGVLVIASIVIGVLMKKDTNVEFYQLKKYLSSKGFVCESMKSSGSACKYNSDNVKERFIRYEKGFDYLYNNKSYVIEIYHVDGEDKILFNTGENAFDNYKNLKYSCTFKESILNEIEECSLVDDEDVKLDNEAYISVINQKIYDVNLIIEASKYSKADLINKYEWNKK